MTDHKREATYHGDDLPRRTPMETFAQHGAPPPVTPGRPPWDSQAHQDLAVQHGWPTPGQPKRGKWRAWNPIVWVLIGVAALVLCGVGGIALLGAGGKAVVNTVNNQATARASEVKITSCTGPDEFGMVTVKYTIHNGSDEVQSYLPQFDLGDGKGTVYGQAADVVNNLAAGKDYRGSAANVVQAPKGAKIVCSVTGA